MIELHPRLFVGDQSTCLQEFEGLVVVHACKSPCHQWAVGYRGSLPPDHEFYLAMEDVRDLYLNLIDPPTPLFKVDSFLHFRDFAESRYLGAHQALLIHCNQGHSRVPSLALLFLAKDLHVLPDDSYAAAVEAFQRASCNLTDLFANHVKITFPLMGNELDLAGINQLDEPPGAHSGGMRLPM
jgi:hypothetical protein